MPSWCTSLCQKNALKGLSENGGRELFPRQLTPRPGPKVTFRNTWVKSDSSTSNQLGETDACRIVLKPNPAYSESSSWANQNGEQNNATQLTTGLGKPEADDQTILQIDLRVNAVPNDEIYKDEQYMQSITKQIEKLAESLQEEPLKINILVKKPRWKFMKQAIASCTKFNKEPSKYNVSVAKLTWKLDSKYVHAGGKLDMTEDMLSRIRRNFANSSRTSIICRFRKARI